MATLWRALSLASLAVYAIGCAHPNAAARQDQIKDTTKVADLPAHRSSTTVTAVKDRVGPNETLQMALIGNVSGLEVTETAGGGVAIQIRGPCSFFASCEPLYIVDGAPVQPGPSGSLTWLNPHDIESIEVLKDPGQTALYGVRGGNGVIVIKTKLAQVQHKH